MADLDWRRVTFTEHMTEAALVGAECHVVLDFGTERAAYEVKVYRPLKGADARYFAVGTNRDEPQGFCPVGDGDTPEAALQACLEGAGVYHAGRASERVRLDGSCQCGKVRFRVESDTPYPFMFSYCSICRKTTGGPCGCNIMGRRETLRITGKRFECQAAH